MSVVQIDPTPGAGSDYDLAKVSTIAELGSFGRDRVSLTEWSTTTVPAVAQGSLIEAGGAIYQVNADSAITVGSVSDGDVYIVFDTNNLTTAPFYFTNTAPVWSDAKQGYYDTSSGFKVLNFKITKTSTAYTKELGENENRLYPVKSKLIFSAVNTGTKSMPVATTKASIPAFDTVGTNFANSLNTTSNRFTAKEAGTYMVSFRASTVEIRSSIISCVKNDTDVLWQNNADNVPRHNMSVTENLDVGDYIDIYYSTLVAPDTLSGLTTGGVSNIITSFASYSCVKIG